MRKDKKKAGFKVYYAIILSLVYNWKTTYLWLYSSTYHIQEILDKIIKR